MLASQRLHRWCWSSVYLVGALSEAEESLGVHQLGKEEVSGGGSSNVCMSHRGRALPCICECMCLSAALYTECIMEWLVVTVPL